MRGNIPKTLEVLRKSPDAAVSVYMRKDLTLSVPVEKKVTLESTDMQKWRGITLNMGELESQIKSGKEDVFDTDKEHIRDEYRLLDVDIENISEKKLTEKTNDFNKYCTDYIIKAIDFIKTIFIEE